MPRKRRAASEDAQDRARQVVPVHSFGEPRDDGESRAILFDPDELAVVKEFVEASTTHSVYGNYALSSLARSPWAAAVLNLRVNQVAEYGQPAEGPYSIGFRFAKREGQNKSLNTTEEKEIERLKRLALQCGEITDEMDEFNRDDFEGFLRKTAYDSLVYDALPFEVIPDNGGRPKWWQAVDGATIFRARPKNPYGYGRDDVAWVQQQGVRLTAAWPADLFCYGIRRPRSDLKAMGYGTPELSDLIGVITGLLYGWTYNMSFFRNSGARGVLSVMGDIPKREFRLFKREMIMAAQGVKNAFRMAVVNPQGDKADIKFIPFGIPTKDMEFAEWINACFRLMCAVYGVDPSEVGFYYGAPGQRESMFEASPEAKVKRGEDHGLVPLLRMIQKNLNKYVFHRLNEDFSIYLTRNVTMSEKEQAELDRVRVTTKETINEARARDLLPPIEGGDIILNPTYTQAKMAAAQQGGMGGGDEGDEWGADDGEPGQEGEGEGGDEGDFDLESFMSGMKAEGKSFDSFTRNLVAHARRKMPPKRLVVHL